ncbi:MAG: cell division ATP-binding protein FtsE [Pseudobdellovibrionaceae bacterium]
MIEFSHVYKTFNGSIKALKNIDLKIGKGEFVFLTGPSGAGKSTLFRLISGYDKVTSGAIRVAGFDLSKIQNSEMPFFRRKIGVVFQDFKLLADRTIFENIALPLEIRGENPDVVSKKVTDVLHIVGLSHKREHYPETLSGGEQQRTAIARALISQPGVLIADEPTGNLDPKLSEEIMSLLMRVSEQGTTVFVATHDERLVQKFGKRRIHIVNGEIAGAANA